LYYIESAVVVIYRFPHIAYEQSMEMTISDAVKQMLSIVKGLQKSYPKKKFTLDGRLVGDLGEILVEDAYDVELFRDLQKHHDGKTSDGRLVQIKATMHGPGSVAWEAVKNRKPTRTNLHSIGINTLKALNGRVKREDRIPRRVEPLQPKRQRRS
jgi:hypothetical protein